MLKTALTTIEFTTQCLFFKGNYHFRAHGTSTDLIGKDVQQTNVSLNCVEKMNHY